MDGSVMEQRDALSGRAGIEVPSRLSVSAAPDCARFSLRVGRDDREAVGRALGVDLPGRIGGLATLEDTSVLCLGPDEWSVVAPDFQGRAVLYRFEDLGVPHSLVDTSHRDVGIELRGPATELALSACCTLDLASMPDGSVTRTILDKAQVVLVKHDPEHYRIDVWQSYAGHVWGLLEAVSREIALDL